MISDRGCNFKMSITKIFLILLIQYTKHITCQNATGTNQTTNTTTNTTTISSVTTTTKAAESSVAMETTTMCGSVTCLHGGVCKTKSDGNNGCQCESEFEGLSCQIVKLKVLEFMINSTSVTFFWKVPPRLNGYEFVYTLKYDTNAPLAYQNITMNENSRDATLANLVSGAMTYLTCIIEAGTIINASNPTELSTIVNKDNSNCFSFTTSYDGNDPYTKAAIGVAIAMGGVILILVIMRWGVDCGRKVTKNIKTLGFERAASQWIHKMSAKDEGKPTENVNIAIEAVGKQMLDVARANPSALQDNRSVASSGGQKFTRGMKKKYADLAMSDLPVGDINRGHKPGGARHKHGRMILSPDPNLDEHI
ncbi:unnamed protein product [Owenia fusiformis]|uniref:EGF-like domain-containing protein n=1 Tax=Owenia fusiformis TaxID=6347 RepID=A0A8S4N2B2_OWEFU|nr:unnamed protein product [Owenia fusiformis]